GGQIKTSGARSRRPRAAGPVLITQAPPSPMLTFIVRRLLWMVVLLLIISFLTFLIFYTLPSADPALLRAGRNPSPELVASIRKTLGLDQPFYVQYGKYLQRLVFHFDFGYSYQN